MKTEDKLRALLIDDDTAVRESLRFYLEDCSYSVVEAANGKEGLEQFRATAPDIVLVDLRMPEMDGHQVLEVLSKETPKTPLIVISGTGHIKDTVKALRLGAWDYILKPINDLAILSHAMQKALERSRLLRENHDYQEHLENEVAYRTKELTEKIEEMTRFNRMAVGRERRILELKRQINSLLAELGREPKYESPEMIEEEPNPTD
jgi:DNA-binding NtrC family response regulator